MALYRAPLAKFAVAAVAVFCAVVVPLGSNDHLLSLANLVGIAVVGAIGLNILTGFTGQISIGHGAFMAVGGYYGMAAIVHAAKATQGKMDTEQALKALKGWKFNSPRGPIMIDPETRDIVMNEYLSEVVKGPDGKLHQKQLGKIDNP